MDATCSPRGEYKPTDSMTESARARWRARYMYLIFNIFISMLTTLEKNEFLGSLDTIIFENVKQQ